MLLALFWVGPHAKNERSPNPKLEQYGYRRWRCPDFLTCITMLVWGFRYFQSNLAYCAPVHSTNIIIPTCFQLGGRKCVSGGCTNVSTCSIAALRSAIWLPHAMNINWKVLENWLSSIGRKFYLEQAASDFRPKQKDKGRQ